MTKPYTRYIKEKTKYLLWAKTAGRCQYDGHNKPLWRDEYTKAEMNFAEIAHIIGNSSLGPRGRPALTAEYCNDVANLMLLCPDHHRLVDADPLAFPVEQLREWKNAHERRIEAVTEIEIDKTSNVVLYGANIGQNSTLLTKRAVVTAMSQAGWYPARADHLDLSLHHSQFHDRELKFWTLEEENLKRQFASKIQPIIEDSTQNHFSIFALAPQPLLIRLGTLLTDLLPAEVYQLHREPPNWEWQPGPTGFNYEIHTPDNFHSLVALNLSLSATIVPARIAQALGNKEFSLWTMTIPLPSNDFLRSREQLQRFREQFRQMLDQIKAQHGQNAELHIFPAVPVSVAIEIGRVRQAKADLPYVIYDQNRDIGGFSEALRIGF